MPRHCRLRACATIVFAALVLPSSQCSNAVEATVHPPSARVDIDWQTSPLDLDLRGMNGERYVFRCPHGKPQPAHVTGSGPYTDDSSICSAAVHAGVLHASAGGDVAIEIRPGEDHYTGSDQHYVRSNDSEHRWSGSFIVLKNTRDVGNP